MKELKIVMYLLHIEYSDDAERKRIEYVLEKWEKSVGIEKLKGMTLLIQRKIPEFLEELAWKMNPKSLEKMKIYSLVEEIPSAFEKRTTSFEIETSEKPEIARRLFELVMSRNNAKLLPGETNKYFLLTRKGRVEIEVSENGNKFSFRITGSAEAVEKFSDRLKKDLKFFLGDGNV